MEFNKKLSKSGAVTIPAALRRELGIDQGERFKVKTDDNGSITLTRTQGSCIFCQSDNNLIAHAGRFICADCLQEINKVKARQYFSSLDEGSIKP
jgi:transcriptional pleiotropic regulator of transition state genes